MISLQNNSTLMSLFPYKVVDRDKYIGRIDVPDGDENPENIYIRLAPGLLDLVLLHMLLKNWLLLGGLHLCQQGVLPEIAHHLIAAECEACIGSKKDKAMEYTINSFA